MAANCEFCLRQIAEASCDSAGPVEEEEDAMVDDDVDDDEEDPAVVGDFLIELTTPEMIRELQSSFDATVSAMVNPTDRVSFIRSCGI